jgi:hypothetical protein
MMRQHWQLAVLVSSCVCKLREHQVLCLQMSAFTDAMHSLHCLTLCFCLLPLLLLLQFVR